MPFSIKKQIRSFGFAWDGIKFLIRTQPNAWIQLTVAILVIAASFFFKVSNLEWIAILLCIGGVIALEAVNTAIEKLCDTLHPEIHEGIKHTKDLGAGAVLIMSIIAVSVGLLIFAPRIIQLVENW